MKIERKKLILIIAIILTVVLGSLVIALSVLTRPAEVGVTPTPTPTSVSPTDSSPTAEPDSVGAIVGDPESPDAPPANMYQNDSSNDLGYAPLPESYKSSTDPNPTGTVLDEAWAMGRYQTLVCELSAKESSTEEALQPIKAFAQDLTLANYQNASTMRAGISRWVDSYEGYLGERAPGSTRSELILECQTITDGVEEEAAHSNDAG
jgi:hypothetical protein